jgi:hypothetical protein
MKAHTGVLHCGIRVVAVWSAIIGIVRAGSVDDELRSRSHTEGLGIAWFAENGKVAVQHFDGVKVPEVLSIPGLSGLYDIDATSQAFLGSLTRQADSRKGMPDSLFAPYFGLFSLRGGEPTLIGLRRWPRAAVVSSSRKMLAVLMVDSRLHRVSLIYGDVAWASPQTAYSFDLGDDPEHLTVVNYVEEGFGWSADALRLVYSKLGNIYIFDTQTKSARLIAAGSDPSWSPDGQFIAYRSVQHVLMLYTPAEERVRVLTRGVDVRGLLRWSPDSQLVLFTRFSQQRAALNPFTHDATDFVALRVSDGASAVAFEPGNGADTRRFFWIKTGRRD